VTQAVVPNLCPLVLAADASRIAQLFGTPLACAALAAATPLAGAAKGHIAPHEALVLYHLAAQYDRSTARLLELGTLAGYSAVILAQAAPLAHLWTLNPAPHEYHAAMETLAPYRNVTLCNYASWDYLPAYRAKRDGRFALVFVDADHKHAARDLPWWQHLLVGGLMLWHDYDAESGPAVVATLQQLGQRLGRPLDVAVTDTQRLGRGLAGFYKRKGEDDAWRH